MATTILSSGTAAGTSSNVVVAAGSNATVGMFATGEIPAGVQLRVVVTTPGDASTVGVLNSLRPNLAIHGPGTFQVIRPDISSYGLSVGAFSEP